MPKPISREDVERWLRAKDPDAEVGLLGAHCLHPICTYLREQASGWSGYLDLEAEKGAFLGCLDSTGSWLELLVDWALPWDRFMRDVLKVRTSSDRLLVPVSAGFCLAALLEFDKA